MQSIIFNIVILSSLLLSCGSDKKGSISKNNEFEVYLELSGNDAMRFDKYELRVKAGQKVTLELTHTGKLDKAIMGHNFVLLKKGTDIAKFVRKAADAKNNDYIPESDEFIVNTKLIGGGESVIITFDAPAKGVYDFICSFPGHYGMMKGKFMVE